MFWSASVVSAASGADPAPVKPPTANAPLRGVPGTSAQRGVDGDYKIGPEDLLEVQVYSVDGLRRDVRVNSRGVITLPLIGAVQVGRLTSQEAEALIAEKYEKDYIRNPQVSVFIKEFTERRITVEGAVPRPGMYPIKGEMTLLKAMALVGGLDPTANTNEVTIYRAENGSRKSYTFDVIRVRSGEIQDPQLMDDDVVVALATVRRVTVEGAAARPGIYPMRGDATLLQALALAGQGPLADMNNVLVMRMANGAKQTTKYDVLKIRSGDAIDPTLQDDDIVVLNRSTSRVALTDSLFRDILNTVNPLTYIYPSKP